MFGGSSSLRFIHLVGAFSVARDPSGFLVLKGHGNTTIVESQTALELVAEWLCLGACPGLLCDLVGLDELPHATTVVRLVDEIEDRGVFTAGVALLLRPGDQTRVGQFAADYAAVRGLKLRAFTRYNAARDWLIERVVKRQA